MLLRHSASVNALTDVRVVVLVVVNVTVVVVVVVLGVVMVGKCSS